MGPEGQMPKPSKDALVGARLSRQTVSGGCSSPPPDPVCAPWNGFIATQAPAQSLLGQKPRCPFSAVYPASVLFC